MKTSRALLPFVLAASQNIDVVFPVGALKDIKDYHERVEPGEEEPAGEDPITGALAHAQEYHLPSAFSGILDAVNEANASGEIVVGFGEDISPDGLELRIWTTPRHHWSETDGRRESFYATISPMGVRIVREHLARERAARRLMNAEASVG